MSEPTTRRWTFRLAVIVVAVALVAAAVLGWWWLWGAGQQNVARAGKDASTYLSGCDRDQGSSDATIGLLTLPGSSTAWPIRVGDAALDAGVGWYQQTAEPG